MNMPSVKKKIEDYINELDLEIQRLEYILLKAMAGEAYKVIAIESRIDTLVEVRNDLQSRLDEVL